MIPERSKRFVEPFNSTLEIGLRSLCILTAAYPSTYSLQQLIIFDYILVHSDDMPGGPTGLDPQTPHRGGEILVRRGVLQDGLFLYQSRNLVECIYQERGIFFSATDSSASFLDSLSTEYVIGLRERADWIVDSFGLIDDTELNAIVYEQIGKCGAELSMQSVLWEEEIS